MEGSSSSSSASSSSASSSSTSSSSTSSKWLKKFRGLLPSEMSEKDFDKMAKDLHECCKIGVQNNLMSPDGEKLVKDFFTLLLKYQLIDIRCSTVSNGTVSNAKDIIYTSESEGRVYKTEVFIANKENSEYQESDYKEYPWLNPWMINYIKLLTIIRCFGDFLCKE